MVLAERTVPEERAQRHLQGGAPDEHQRALVGLRQRLPRLFASGAGQRRVVWWWFSPQDAQAAEEQRDAAQGVARAVDQVP